MAVGDVVFSRKEDEYISSANEVVHIKLVGSEEDVKNADNAFLPEMSHQIFGDNESIFGYKGLDVKLFYHAGSLLTYLGMEYKEMVPASLGMEADKVLPNIAEKLGEGCCTNLDEFIASLPAENSFKPIGTKIHSYKRKDIEYEVYQADISMPRLRSYHERLQLFLLWYIDAASFIDVDDEKWKFFLIFEKRKSSMADFEYRICGYLTVYHYYAYPANIRPRISQMIILPPYQKSGHGAELLRVVYSFYENNPNVVDVTVEDPSEDFVRLRDFVDCQRCKTLPSFEKKNLKLGYNEKMMNDAKTKFKIGKQQARRVYEILRLRSTNTADPVEYRNYRLDIKQRLNVPFQKEARDVKKLQRHLSQGEMQQALADTLQDERLKRLDEAYTLLEEDYKRVLDRLAAA